MTSASSLHLPLSPEIDEMLREEVEHSGKPAATVALEALRNWLSPRHERRLHDQISAWAAQHAGTDLDLDVELERAGLEVLTDEPSR